MLITLSLINLSTVELLITIPTKKLLTSLDIVIYPTRGVIFYYRSFLLGGVGIVGYMGGGVCPSLYPSSLGPPSEVLYRGIMLDLIRALFKKFFYYFFSENWVFISPSFITEFYSYCLIHPIYMIKSPPPYYKGVIMVGVKTFCFENR